jgi:LytS/YehU family sensor histidine kinase
MKYSKINYILVYIQAFIWIILLIIPIGIAYVSSKGDMKSTLDVASGTIRIGLPTVVLYLLNFYWLVPSYLFNKRYFKFYGINILLLLAIGGDILYPHYQMNLTTFLVLLSFALTNVIVLGCATGIRYIIRWNDMQVQIKEKERKDAEAELIWLKNQLNPHFLFNTLNNISSLVQIDADTAQESIGQLSDLLRYALYDSNKKEVPLENEIEFMNNYIELMKLRCNDLVQIDVDMPKPSHPILIAPLLFISLIENAFKHGVNNRTKSFIRISLHTDNQQLTFTVENSLLPKPETDHVGSGIGIENLKRRLELVYPKRYEYKQESKDDTYRATIMIKETV